MKTNQKLEISYQGMIFAQDMHKKMIYVNELEIEILKQTGLLDKRFNIFMTRKDTKEFIKVLKVSENLQDEEIIYGRGKTKRIHHLLAFKFATWVSKEFELIVYKFFMEYYPVIRELGGDRYNDFRLKYLPKIYDGDNAKWIITSVLGICFGVVLHAFYKLEVWKIIITASTTILSFIIFRHNYIFTFVTAIIGLSYFNFVILIRF